MRNNRSTPRSVHNTPHVAQPTGRSHATRRTSNCAWLIYSTARLVGPSGIFVQMGLRWVSGMSEIDDLVGTGLDTIYSSWPCVRGSPAGSPSGGWDYFVLFAFRSSRSTPSCTCPPSTGSYFGAVGY